MNIAYGLPPGKLTQNKDNGSNIRDAEAEQLISDRIRNSAIAANAHDFIMDLPQDYSTRVRK